MTGTQIDSVAVIGLGKVGACLAACLASKGLEVTGVDLVLATVDAVNTGRAPVTETGLEALIAANRPRLRATLDIGEAIERSVATFIVVPTPSDASGDFSLITVQSAIEAIGRALRDRDAYHLVVLTSTVQPGACEGELVPLLEAASGRQVGNDLGFCYNPEFIALGSVLHDFLQPDLVLIGESDARAGDALAALYARVLEVPRPVQRLSLVNAELTKLALNSYVTMKIGFANLLANICERLPGGDIDAVTATLGLDRRIGASYLTGALGYGGPCFPRDNIALANVAVTLGVDAGVVTATDAANRSRVESIVDWLAPRLGSRRRVSVLGLAYKPGTPVIEASQGLALAEALDGRGYDVTVYDPLALEALGAVLGEAFVYASSIDQALRDADAVVIANADPAFATLSEADFASLLPPVLVFDCWRLLRGALASSKRIEYVAIGLGDEARSEGALEHD